MAAYIAYAVHARLELGIAAEYIGHTGLRRAYCVAALHAGITRSAAAAEHTC